jgi:hypothetical protein
MYAHLTVWFDQATWTGTWADVVSGANASGEYDKLNYPVALDNQSCITERWRISFTSSTTVDVYGETVGVIVTGYNISSGAATLAPINPASSFPYFTLYKAGFGGGWATGNQIRFNTIGAQQPLWLMRAISGGSGWDQPDSIYIEFRGDANP